jgi:DNA-binding Xre family transcriptional regulator
MESGIKSNVKQIMKKKGVKYTDFQDLGFSPKTVAKAVKNIDTCKLGTLKRLATVLGCNVSDLYEEVPPQTAPL